MSIALFLFSTIGTETPNWQVMIYMFVMGAGLGQCMQTLLLAIQNDAEPRDMGVATASATFFRQIGGTVGTAVFLSILFSTVGDKIAEGLKAAMQTEAFKVALSHNPEFAKSLQAGGGAGVDINNTEFLNGLDPVLAKPFLDGFSSAIDTVFMTGGIVMVAAFVLVWFLREKPLSTRSGLERVADAEAVVV